MKKELKFSIQGLLSKTKEGNISGPMSPMLFAKEMAKQIEFKFNRLARIWFNDEEIFQVDEGAEGLTYHDILIIGCQYANDLSLSLWVDSGVGGLAVAMCCQSDREIIITPIYEQTVYSRKLTRKEIEQVFNHVFNNPQEIAIKPYKE